MGKIMLFPQRMNVGKDKATGEMFNEALAARLVKTKLWGYTPMAENQDDVNLFLNKAKSEIADDAKANRLEAERLKQEREDLERLRAELLTGSKTKKKTEV
jgi:hypothetical protein